MSKLNKAARVALAATAVGAVAVPSASAAQINQLCKTNTFTSIVTDSETVQVLPGSLIRILGYSGDYYRYRYANLVSYIPRAWVTNSTCYWQ